MTTTYNTTYYLPHLPPMTDSAELGGGTRSSIFDLRPDAHAGAWLVRFVMLSLDEAAGKLDELVALGALQAVSVAVASVAVAVTTALTLLSVSLGISVPVAAVSLAVVTVAVASSSSLCGGRIRVDGGSDQCCSTS